LPIDQGLRGDVAFDDVRFVPILQLSQVFDGYQQARVGLRRIGDLLRTPTAVQLPADRPAQQLPVLRRTPATSRRSRT
jgi:ATP-binding cassette, subfamily B, bacterial